MKGIFITGTDTGVGKTITSALLFSALKKAGKSPKYFKPVQTGLDDDTEILKSLTETSYIESVYKFRDPISPNRAAALAHEEIDLEKILDAASKVGSEEFLIVEGAGGLMVPLNQRENIRDLVFKLELPLVIVASTRLGTINHALLTLECTRAKNINVKGLILVGPEDPGLAETLKSIGDAPILAEIPIFKVSQREIQTQSLQLFPSEILKQICGDQ